MKDLFLDIINDEQVSEFGLFEIIGSESAPICPGASCNVDKECPANCLPNFTPCPSNNLSCIEFWNPCPFHSLICDDKTGTCKSNQTVE